MSEIATIRRRVGDRSKAQKDIATGNGKDRSFHLQYQNVFSLIVSVEDTELVEGNDYTLDAAGGRVIFAAPPMEQARVVFDYNYAAYTDAELTDLIAEFGLDGATVAILEELTADTARYYDYTQGESANKRSQVFDHLMKLLETYRTKATATKKGSGVRFGKRSAPDRTLRREPNFGGTQDLTRYP